MAKKMLQIIENEDGTIEYGKQGVGMADALGLAKLLTMNIERDIAMAMAAPPVTKSDSKSGIVDKDGKKIN